MTSQDMTKVTMTEAEMVYIRSIGNGQHLLRDKNNPSKIEVWFNNKGHASYGIRWRNTDLEFVRTATVEDLRR
jgi:hypothetical protein